MRIFPIALIIIGVLGVLKYFGFIDPGYVHLLWPFFLIAIGASMLLRRRHWHADMYGHMQDRWEHRMIRRFGPGWANLSEEERERFRAGMQQWHGHRGMGSMAAGSAASTAADNGTTPAAPGEQR